MQALGVLYIVATPIGNLEDITFRAVRILKEVDFIYAEDTRTSAGLLKHYDISTRCRSFNSMNEEQKISDIKNVLSEGKSVAIISDAGTPGISDPSVRLVSALRKENFTICPIPGASAIITALSAAGLPTHRFHFIGFLPIKKGRQTLLKSLIEIEGTLVFYESPYRIIKTLEQINEFIGNRYIVVCRELTKKFEQFISGHVLDIINKKDAFNIKGEFVVLVAGAEYDHRLLPKNDEEEN
jgi:16S rRNA (cytidine1402-2'-O)-methyltransferase